MTLYLPWPPSKLNPNQRVHYQVKAKIAAKYKSDCYYAVKADAMSKLFADGKIRLIMTFHPPDRRDRDIDNLLAAMKAGLDGVSLAYGINDKRFRPITLDFGDVIKGGAVKIEFHQDFVLTSERESQIVV